MNSPILLRRGCIVLVALDPAVGSEAVKVRPAVVVSNNTANSGAARSGTGMVTIVPVTSNTATLFPFQVLLPSTATGLPHDSKAQAEQVRAVSIMRLQRALGWVPAELMGELDEALRLHLAL